MDFFSFFPLQAARNGNIGQVTEILAEKADVVVNAVDDRGFTALHYAVQNNHEDIAKLLILNGAGKKQR